MGGLGLPEITGLLVLITTLGIIVISLRQLAQKPQATNSKREQGNSNTRSNAKGRPEAVDTYDVFISYRREYGSESARLIRSELQRYNIRVFLDVDDLRSGHFNEDICQYITNTPNYIVILSKGSLDRCIDEQDWLRQEIVQALKAKRNIIPILMPGFEFPEYRVMPYDIQELRLYQSIVYSHDFFDAMVQKIRKYLQ